MGVRVQVQHANRCARIDTDEAYSPDVVDHLASTCMALINADEIPEAGARVEFGFHGTDEDGDDDAEG